jgi:hypothetical protein
MKKENSNSVLIPLLLIPFGGLASLGICYALYYFIYMFAETTIYQGDTFAVPAGIIRNTFAVVIILIYLLVLRTKWDEPLKAAIGVGPVALVFIAVVLALYLKPLLAVVVVLFLAACYVAVLYRNRKPWFYYFAVALSVIAAIFYALPR